VLEIPRKGDGKSHPKVPHLGVSMTPRFVLLSFCLLLVMICFFSRREELHAELNQTQVLTEEQLRDMTTGQDTFDINTPSDLNATRVLFSLYNHEKK